VPPRFRKKQASGTDIQRRKPDQKQKKKKKKRRRGGPDVGGEGGPEKELLPPPEFVGGRKDKNDFFNDYWSSARYKRAVDARRTLSRRKGIRDRRARERERGGRMRGKRKKRVEMLATRSEGGTLGGTGGDGSGSNAACSGGRGGLPSWGKSEAKSLGGLY